MPSEFLVPITLPADPTNPLEAATKQYVDGKSGPLEVIAQAAAPGAGATAVLWVDTDDISVGADVTAPPPTVTGRVSSVVSGRLIYPADATSGGTQDAALGNAYAFFFPIVTATPAQIASFTTYCWTAQTGATLRVGVYNVNDYLQPTTLIADAGTLLGDTTGIKTVTAPVSLSVLRFAVCVWQSNHATARWTRITPVTAPGIYGDTQPAGYGGWMCMYLNSPTDYSAGLPADVTAIAKTHTNHSLSPGIRAPYVYPKVA